MHAKYRTDVSSGKAIVSNGKKAGDCYTVVTDWESEMAGEQACTHVIRGSESSNRPAEVS